MTASEYLRQIGLMDNRLKQKMALVVEMKSTANGLKGVAYDADRVQTSPDDRMANTMAKIIDLEYEIMDDVYALTALKTEVVKNILRLNNEKYESVLFYRYVNRRTFQNIAIEMDCDIRHVFRLHGKALRIFDQKILKNPKKT